MRMSCVKVEHLFSVVALSKGIVSILLVPIFVYVVPENDLWVNGCSAAPTVEWHYNNRVVALATLKMEVGTEIESFFVAVQDMSLTQHWVLRENGL